KAQLVLEIYCLMAHTNSFSVKVNDVRSSARAKRGSDERREARAVTEWRQSRNAVTVAVTCLVRLSTYHAPAAGKLRIRTARYSIVALKMNAIPFDISAGSEPTIMLWPIQANSARISSPLCLTSFS